MKTRNQTIARITSALSTYNRKVVLTRQSILNHTATDTQHSNAASYRARNGYSLASTLLLMLTFSMGVISGHAASRSSHSGNRNHTPHIKRFHPHTGR